MMAVILLAARRFAGFLVGCGMTHIIQKGSHPAVEAAKQRMPRPVRALGLDDLERWAAEAGADDVGVVSLDHPDLAEERAPVLEAFPAAKTLVSIVVRMHPENVRSPSRSVANQDFHRAGETVDAVAWALVRKLSEAGHRAMNPAMAFPMEMDDFPGRTWVVSHKRVAMAAGLGLQGLHRNVIHPRFGSFVVLGTVLTTADIAGRKPVVDVNPCVDCKLCVAACPVGAIEPDGGFRFSACLDHNYREFMTGFGDLLEEVAEAKDRHALRDKVSISESASMWQSLAYKPNYKAAHCIAVCPAGDEVLTPFVTDRPGFLKEVVRPLTERREPVYVVAGSDAEAHVQKRFPHKPVRRVRSSLRATSAPGFFRAMPLVFQRGPARGWRATFHFELTDDAKVVHRATARIDDGTLTVNPSAHDGVPDVVVRGEAQAWLDVVSGKSNPVWLVVRRRLRLEGDRSLLERFAKCFPR